jgi:hypothetical protein
MGYLEKLRRAQGAIAPGYASASIPQPELLPVDAHKVGRAAAAV